MKKLFPQFIVFLFAILTFPYLGIAQDSSSFELSCKVNKVYPYISISKEQLAKAQTISDLNHRFKSSWIKEYIAVEISASHDGKIMTISNKKHELSQAQKDLMNKADSGTEISINIQYIPDNTLSHNDVKEIDFSFIPDPENAPQYLGGQTKLEQYLKENILDKIPHSIFKQHQLTAIKFTINKEGEIENPHIVESSKDEKTDEILLTTVQKMPCWKPAEHANGKKEEQEFVLTVGDMNSCVVNLLSIRKNY